MGQLVFQATLGGTTALVGPNTASTNSINIPDASGTLAISGGSTSFTNLAYTGTLTGGTGVVNLGSGQFYKDASGNVGIGTSTLSGKLSVLAQASTTYGNFDVTTAGFGFITFKEAGTALGYIGPSAIGSGGKMAIASASTNPLVFATNATEAMRIDASGYLLVNTTASVGGAARIGVLFAGNATNGIHIQDSTTTSGAVFMQFSNSAGTAIGNISRVTTTNAVVYNTTSDQRLKSNIEDANPVLDKLMTVRVRQFDWTDGDLHQDAGFIAQELAPILSGIVTEGKTEEDMWQMDYSRLTPYLLKAIQELNAKLEAQAVEIATLKGK